MTCSTGPATIEMRGDSAGHASIQASVSKATISARSPARSLPSGVGRGGKWIALARMRAAVLSVKVREAVVVVVVAAAVGMAERLGRTEVVLAAAVMWAGPHVMTPVQRASLRSAAW